MFKIFSMFDGVSGIPLGLQQADSQIFQTKYINQYEPSRKRQDAFNISTYNMPKINHSNCDINYVSNTIFQKMRQNQINMIVAGFPCQDYSVARPKTNSTGIQGKKGVLFWQIMRAISIIQPHYILLENVDHLLKSPSSQKGRDFAIMLTALNQNDYTVEWRVINSADYGFPQRRKRIYIIAYKNLPNQELTTDWVLHCNIFNYSFPIQSNIKNNCQFTYDINKNISDISHDFTGQFYNTGIMHNGKIISIQTVPICNPIVPMKTILQPDNDIPDKYYINDTNILHKYQYFRGAKRIKREKNGHIWFYAQGRMSDYDDIDIPARTILTSEGTVNRSTHLLHIHNRYRTLTPVEVERLQGFPDNWTQFGILPNGEKYIISDRARMFIMGNALVIGIITKIGESLIRKFGSQ